MVLPELSPALVAGVALSFTRSLGEFGAVIFIAGNIAWKTEVTSLMILCAYRSLITRSERDCFGDPRGISAAAVLN